MGDRTGALAFFNNAVAAHNNKEDPKNAQVAYQFFVSAVTADPTFAVGWYYLAAMNSDLGLPFGAIACYRRFLELPLEDGQEPQLPFDRQPGGRTRDLTDKALVTLGQKLHSIGKNDEALEVLERAVFDDPKHAAAYVSLSQVHGEEQDTKKALWCAQKAYELEDNPVNEMAYAFALLFDRQFMKGLAHFEARFPYRFTEFLHMPYPKWRGESGKVLWLVADQGLGDTLSYARFVERAAERCTMVHIICQAELLRLFSICFGHLKNIRVAPLNTPRPHADYWTTFVSLPWAMGLSNNEYIGQSGIKIPPFNAPSHWKATDRLLHVGIAWSGSPFNDINPHRSIPIAHFIELAQVPGVQLYSLQADDASQQIYEHGAGPIVRDLKPWIREISDTLAILRDLDLVITCESAMGHIAGAAGIETWVPYSWRGRDYRIGPSSMNGSLWYPKHMIFQQGREARWEPVFDRIRAALEDKIKC
ncbi:MAG: hypothetical protein C5B50_00690 [Verrucomicrobia bacterium]|nr:MAG: hypothetical protein C5B50_00690 [Verrucomicrobiota bacterium]